MRARCWTALAAAALAASGARAANDGTCELSRADRQSATSRDCIACHDGSRGTAVGYRISGAQGPGPGHPVEVDYGAAASTHPNRFQPPSALPPGVPLVGGKIECTTCHDGASPVRNHIAAVGNRAAVVRDLCLACHVF